MDADKAREVLAGARRIRTEAEVAASLDRMAEAIAAEIADAQPVVLAAMNGGAFAAVELCKRFKFPYEFDFAHPARYGRALVGGKLEWRVAPSHDLSGRVVLVVDDVLDHGVTLTALCDALAVIGARRVLSAVLVRKNLGPSAQQPEPDFVGLDVENLYLFGCGMDYAGYWRGLPALYAVELESA